MLVLIFLLLMSGFPAESAIDVKRCGVCERGRGG
jgi:hypothetical protein